VEISSLLAQQSVVESGAEDRVTVSRQATQASQNQETQSVTDEDRVELVRTQNLASPPPEEVDVDQAQLLLQQVQQDWSQMNRSDLRELYQFDRLRDLCCQIQQAEF
jgi:hypothetical protein